MTGNVRFCRQQVEGVGSHTRSYWWEMASYIVVLCKAYSAHTGGCAMIGQWCLPRPWNAKKYEHFIQQQRLFICQESPQGEQTTFNDRVTSKTHFASCGKEAKVLLRLLRLWGIIWELVEATLAPRGEKLPNMREHEEIRTKTRTMASDAVLSGTGLREASAQ